MIGKELLENDVGDSVVEIMDVRGGGLQDSERAFLLEFWVGMGAAAGLARRARDAETYLDDVLHAIAPQKQRGGG